MTSTRTTIDTPALLQRAFENMATAVLVVDEEGVVELINPAAEALLATSANQSVDQPLWALFAQNSQRIRHVLNAARGRGLSLTEREMDARLANGDEIVVDCTITPIEGSTQNESNIVVELQPVDRMLRIRRDEARVAQQLTTNAVVRGLAHEINNPLGGIRGAAQLLQRELSDQAQHEYTQLIIAEADRLQRLLQRMTGPTTVPQRRWCNIHEITERVHNLLRAEAPSEVAFTRDYDPSVPDLRADPEMLIQALINIVRNAVQAVGDSGSVVLRTRVRRQITVGAKRHRLAAAIQVIDSGPGVPPELAERIFFPMVTGRAEGTGLGLSIAQSLAKQHGGLIEFQSKPGHTTFTLLLPLDLDHDEQ